MFAASQAPLINSGAFDLSGAVPEHRDPILIARRIRGISTLVAVVWSCGSAIGGGADCSGSYGTPHIGAAPINAAAIDGSAAVGATSVSATRMNSTYPNSATTSAGMHATGAGTAGTGTASCVGLSGYACEDNDSSRKAGNEDSERHAVPFSAIPIPA